MKSGIKCIIGLTMGASMLGACGPTKYVNGTGSVTSTKASPLRLDIAAQAIATKFNPDGSVNTPGTEVTESRLEGYFHTCLGKPNFAPWSMVLSGNTDLIEGNYNVKVAQDDYSCKVIATKIRRHLQGPGSADGVSMWEEFQFVMIDPGTSGTQNPRVNLFGTHPALQVFPDMEIEIRDGYDIGNLKMAVNQNGTEMGLVNIAGINTGVRGNGSGGYSGDYEINVLTGAASDNLQNTGKSSEVIYAHNIGANAKELNAPTYDLNANAHVFVNPKGYITPSSFGTFKWTVGSRGTISQAGTDFIWSDPQTGTTCTTGIVAPACSDSNQNNPTLLPSEFAYQALKDADKYARLFTRWQELQRATLFNKQRPISTSDKSITIPILTMFPLADVEDGARGHLFRVTNNSTKMEPLHSHAVVIIRNKASGAIGTETDAASGVVSYQAFQLEIAVPPDFL